MQLKKYIDKIPGGMMVIPLILGALLNTITPQVLEIGGFTTAIIETQNCYRKLKPIRIFRVRKGPDRGRFLFIEYIQMFEFHLKAHRKTVL